MSRKVIGFYAPEAFKPKWERFVKKCEGDGSSASSKIREWIEIDLEGFAPFDSQQSLSDYSKEGDDKPRDLVKELVAFYKLRYDKGLGGPSIKDVLRSLQAEKRGRVRVKFRDEILEQLKELNVPVYI